ncbi:MAG: phospholipase D-like domain-containing protein [Candidatus Eisenbacteria bacterium]
MSALVACAPHPAERNPSFASHPPIEIVETYPIETGLGHPETRETLPVWLEFIDGARTSLDLEQFYVSTWPGEALEPVLDAIGRAAERGVAVRLLIDAAMYRTYPQPADSLGGLRGIELRVIDYRKITGGVQHSKLMIADRAELFVGSQNFDWRALSHIHELGVVVRDARVAGAVAEMFDMDWEAAGSGEGTSSADKHDAAPGAATPSAATPSAATPSGATASDTTAGDASAGPEGTGDPGAIRPDSATWDVALSPGDAAKIHVSASPPSRQAALANDLETLVGLIDEAELEIVAQMLSYSVSARGLEETALDDALRRAAARGVHVSLLVSDWQADSESRTEVVKRLSAVPGIDVGMSVVPDYSGGYIPFARVEHCKFLVADTEVAWVGTSNWGPDYFASSRNVGVTIEHEGIAATLRETFARSWNASTTVHVQPDGNYRSRTHREEAPAGERIYGGR